MNEFGESDSSRIHIVDDNHNSSLSSLTIEGNEYRKRPSIERARSMDISIFNDYQASSVSQLSPENKDTRYIPNRKLLSARMEKHRLSRWDASPPPKSWATPTARGSSFRTLSGSTTIPLHEGLSSTAIGTSESVLNKPQVKSVRGILRDNIEPLRVHDDNKAKTNSNSATSLKDDDIGMKNATFDLDPACSYRDFLAGDMDLTNQLIINKALAISDWKIKPREIQDINRDVITNKGKTKPTCLRLKGGRRSKVDSLYAPPPAPIRKESMEDIAGASASFLLTDRRRSTKVEMPNSLLELPYFNCSTHSL